MSLARPFLAFRSGSLTYECAPCGRCCKGLGIADTPKHLSSSPDLVQLGTFLDGDRLGEPLTSLYTFADGCRHLNKDNACDLHARLGPESKPLICRLFPFSRMVDLDGLWVILPHGKCPWGATPTDTPDTLSDHGAIMRELSPELLASLKPEPWFARTPMAPEDRRVLEESIVGSLDPSGSTDSALRRAEEIQTRLCNPPPTAWPAGGDLWLDLLRCAGEPTPLTGQNQRLFVAILPTLRMQLACAFPLEDIPAACGAFELWLRSLAEIRPQAFTGEDLLLLLQGAVGLLRLMVNAERPVVPMDGLDLSSPSLTALGSQLRAFEGKPLGESLLKALRQMEHGALPVLMQLGDALGKGTHSRT